MSRTTAYFLVIAAMFATAVGLRVQSELRRPARTAAPPPTTAPASIPEPHDYVAHPVVAQGERSAGPQRIISLAPSVTEIVCALGMRDRLVGRTQYCTYPPGIEKVPIVGALTDTNKELIKSLRPDLILTTANSGEVIKNLRVMNLRCEPVPHETFDEVYSAILQVGDLCQRPRTARALVGGIAVDLAELRIAAAGMHLPRRRVLVSTGPLPVPPQALWIAGPGSFLDRLLELAGQKNAAREVTQESYPDLPLEKLVVLNPEVILEFRDAATPQALADVYQTWSAVGPLQAIRLHRVRTVGGQEWLSAGPRIAITLHHVLLALADVK